MYFPYFRGRQYELLALKELALGELISDKIIPVIEPIKFIPALHASITAFNNAKLQFGLILNPNVGDLVAEDDDSINLLVDKLSLSKMIIPSVLINESTKETITKLKQKDIPNQKILAVLDRHDYLNIYCSLFEQAAPYYTLCPDERLIRRKVKQNKILFEDCFNKRNRNADYPEDEFFSDNHLDLEADNYVGFGDYSIVGSEYIETGFAPYAVAIHIVYFAEDSSLRIKHFISDSNDDISDVAGKFYQAVTKLHNWYRKGQKKQLTTGLQILLEHYKNGTYPGLPTLKKLSIMHHLELVGKYLDGKWKI